MKVYLIGSLRNPKIPEIGNEIRELRIDCFEDWYSAGERADDSWQAYETGRGHTYAEALQGLAAKHAFSFDKYHLDDSDAGVLVLPAGKSGHLELGYLAGRGKPTAILFDGGPERWDVMYQFADRVFFNREDLYEWLFRLAAIDIRRPDTTKHAYLCGPMRGIPEFNFPAFHTAAHNLRMQGYSVFNPAEEDIKRHGVDISLGNNSGSEALAKKMYFFDPREALLEDLSYICTQADMIAVLPGWENSKGVAAELATARALGIEIIFLE